MAARLATALVDPFEISAEQHRARADKARQWSATLTVAGDVRAMLMRVIELTGRSDASAAAGALDDLSAVSSGHLDEASRAEMRALSQRLIAGAARVAAQNTQTNELRAS